MGGYELKFPIQSSGQDALSKLQQIVQQLGAATANAAPQAAILERQLLQLAGASGGATTAMRALFGTVGLSSAALVAMVGTTGALARATGQLAQEQLNMAERTGLTVREVGLFSAAARVAGTNITAITSSMRTLSQALSSNSEEGRRGKRALEDLGIQAHIASGELKPTGQLFIEIGEALAKIEEPAKRVRLAIALFGLGGLQNLPLLTGDIRKMLAEMERLGAAFTTEGVKKAAAFDQMIGKVIERMKGLGLVAGQTSIAILEAMGKLAPALLGQPGLAAPRAAAVAGTTDFIDLAVARRRASDIAQGNLLARGFQTGRSGTILGVQQQLEEARERLSQLPQPQTGLFESVNRQRISAIENEEGAIIKLTESLRRLEQQRARELRLGEFEAREFGATPGAFARVPSLRGRARGLPLGTFVSQSADIERANVVGRESIAEQGRIQLAGILEREQRVRERNLTLIQQEVSATARIVELRAGPDGEFVAAEKVFKIRLDGAQREFSITKDRAKLEEQVLQIRYDREIQIAQIERDRLQRIRDSSGQVFDALLRGGAGIREFALGQAAVIGRTAFQNVAVEIFKSTTGKVTLPGLGPQGSPNILGRILAGTPFGQNNSLERATDLNTLATSLNTAALRALGTAGGGLGGGALAGLPGLFSGAVGAGGLIFNASGGGASSLPTIGGYDPATGTYSATIGAAAITRNAGGGGFRNQYGSTGATAAVYSAAAIGGFIGVREGIKQGGVQGGLVAASAALGTAAVFDPEPISKAILAVAAAATGLIASLLGSPKEARGREIEGLVEGSRFAGPLSISREFDLGGNQIDYNRRGDLRSFPMVYLTVQTMDARSFIDNRNMIMDAIRFGWQEGHPAVAEITESISLR